MTDVDELLFDENLLLRISLIVPFFLTGIACILLKLSPWFVFPPYLLSFLGNYAFVTFTQRFGLRFTFETVLASAVISTIFWTVFIILTFFFRDPDRISPSVPNGILSPADGTIVAIRHFIKKAKPRPERGRDDRVSQTIENFHPDNPIDEGHLIEIKLDVTGVHIQRAPLSGRVTHQSLDSTKNCGFCSRIHGNKKESLLTVYKNSTASVGIYQITSCMMRRILTFKWIEDAVEQGERVGAVQIRNRIFVLIEKNECLKLSITHGDRVKAGETIIATG